MMKMDCNVTRDLIPLMIDGVASAESMRLVQQHLDECVPCAEYYNADQRSRTAGTWLSWD